MHMGIMKRLHESGESLKLAGQSFVAYLWLIFMENQKNGRVSMKFLQGGTRQTGNTKQRRDRVKN